MSQTPATAVCLVAPPEGEPLAGALVNEVARLTRGEPRWLAPERAAEIVTQSTLPEATRTLLRAAADEAAIDLYLVPVAGRRKAVLVSDMDSTIITIECIDELADMIGIKAEVAAITEAAMAGRLDFEASLTRRVALLEGVAETAIAEICRDRLRLMPGACALVATMRAHGARTALVSGGFSAFTEYTSRLAGFEETEANQLEIVDGRLTGRLIGPIVGPAAKRDALERLAAQAGVPLGATLAVGDGANDRAMLEAAGLGVAFHARPAVEAVADIAIRRGDLRAVLYAQGYDQAEIVEA